MRRNFEALGLGFGGHLELEIGDFFMALGALTPPRSSRGFDLLEDSSCCGVQL